MIRGKRVTLRPFRQEDLPYLRRWHGNGEVMQYWGERLPLVVEGQLEAEFARGGRFTSFDDRGSFCICEETGRPIGRVDYDGGAPRDRRAQIGIMIGEPDAWNRGYGTEAVVLLLNWLFNHRNFHRVWLGVEANNPRAIRVYEKIGFVREGTFREHNFYDGEWRDQHQYGILAAEFNARYKPDQSEWVVTGEVR